MRTTIGQMLKDRIYAMVYGDEGSGKTLLPMTLADENGYGVAYITPEPSGPTSIISLGYPTDIPVEILPPGDEPFGPAIKAIEDFTKDKTIRVIVMDGCTVMSGRAIDHFSGGDGEKALGFDGWAEILSGFRALEAAAERATRANKSFIFTAWAKEPEYEQTMGGPMLKNKGRPFLKGQAQKWLPGNCDIVARITSSMKVKVNPTTKKSEKVFDAVLHVHPHSEWISKTRWSLPNPCPADLKFVLAQVNKQAAAGKKPLPGKVPVNLKVPGSKK